MPRVTGSLVVSQAISSAKFVPHDVHSSVGLPWKLLNNWNAIRDFVEHFNPHCQTKTSEMLVYDIDYDVEELRRWFEAKDVP